MDLERMQTSYSQGDQNAAREFSRTNAVESSNILSSIIRSARSSTSSSSSSQKLKLEGKVLTYPSDVKLPRESPFQVSCWSEMSDNLLVRGQEQRNSEQHQGWKGPGPVQLAKDRKTNSERVFVPRGPSERFPVESHTFENRQCQRHHSSRMQLTERVNRSKHDMSKDRKFTNGLESELDGSDVESSLERPSGDAESSLDCPSNSVRNTNLFYQSRSSGASDPEKSINYENSINAERESSTGMDVSTSDFNTMLQMRDEIREEHSSPSDIAAPRAKRLAQLSSSTARQYQRESPSERSIQTYDTFSRVNAEQGISTLPSFTRASESFHSRNPISYDLQHVNDRRESKRFACAICHKRFAKKYYVTQHLRVHTNERPYSCRFCKRRFNHKSNCDAHMQGHTRNYRFCCTVCFKGYPRKDRMIRHMKSKHSIHFRN
mmetsp:Transcript_27120/g.65926  ORF Transcript_27120/g.65926 Transcript_27120/m.65926 type:complete len:434 (-) Transcript_27120:338-1639(-)